MSNISITAHDISIHKQHRQRRYVMIKVLNREFGVIHTLQGQLISGTITIDATSNMRYTGNISIKINRANMNKLVDFTMDKYIRIYSGTTDNSTNKVSWYLQGTFLIAQNGFNFDRTNRTLSLTLTDLMANLTGDRSGILHEFSTIVKNSQRIDEVMKNVLNMCGVKNYDITPICVLRNSVNYWDENATDSDCYIPYDLEFGTGISGYEILEKLYTLYSYWDVHSNAEGTFICERLIGEEDNSFVILDDRDLRKFVLSENTDVDYSEVKNIVEVWGKDGQYYGDAYDTTPDSPFNANAYPPMREVLSGDVYDNIYDRYKDVKLQDQLLLEKDDYEKEIAKITADIQNCQKSLVYTQKIIDNPESSTEVIETAKQQLQTIEDKIEELKRDRANIKIKLNQTLVKISENLDITGDEMAKQWAEQKLYELCRLKDSITLETIYLPFLNDVNFKISYRSKVDDLVKIYVVKSITHNLENNTTSINAVRFYADDSSAYQPQLAKPIIEDTSINGMTITVLSSKIDDAEKYNLYIDGKLSASSTGTTISFQMPDKFVGKHEVSVVVTAENYRSSESEIMTIELNTGTFIVTANNEVIVTSNNDNIEFNKG